MACPRSLWSVAIGGIAIVVASGLMLAAAEDSVEKPKPPGDTANSHTRSAEVENAIEQLYDAIVKTANGQGDVKDVRRGVANLRKIGGVDPSDVLLEFYEERGGSVRERSVIVRTLQEQKTPQALAALRQIAMKPGREAGTLGPKAVKALAASTEDTDRISELLAADASDVREAATVSLSGKELTDAAVQRLGRLLDSDSWITHSQVVSAFFTDRSTATVARKVDLLLAALPRIEHLADAGKVNRTIGTTPREATLYAYIKALAMMKGSEPVLLKKRDELTAGSLEYKVVVLALALRDNKSVYSSILPIAQGDKDGVLRMLAVEGLGKIGSTKDIDLLERISKNDSFTRSSVSDKTGEAGRTTYPVRREARQAVIRIRKRMTP